MNKLLANIGAVLCLCIVACAVPIAGVPVAEDNSSASKAAPTWPAITKDTTGIDVMALQYFLSAHGYSVLRDGQVTDSTFQAIKKFQQASGLTSTGTVDSTTWKKMVMQVAEGSKGDAVKALQHVLRFKFHYKDVTIDGAYGPKTKQTVEAFKIRFGLSNGATVGETTWQYLLGERPSAAKFWENRGDWIHPLKGGPLADPTGGGRYFGAPRDDGRYHAGVDFIANNGTPVYSMTSGKVIAIYDFYKGTQAVEVLNTDGTICRYCEVSTSVAIGKTLARGDQVAAAKTLTSGSTMLHFEIYLGSATGSLTNRDNPSTYDYVKVINYQRRRDLVDPMGARLLPLKK